MPRISAVILARNEEHNIRHCLGTLGWCDEIVLVDMESDDRTVEIAREYTDRIFSHPKVPAFDIAKKYAVEQATGDWILLIDADEMIQRPLAEELRRLAGQDETGIIEIPFKHFLLGDWVRHSGWGDSPLPRFFRNGAMIIIETIHGYMHKAPNMRTLRLPTREEFCIMHFNYRDSSHFVEKLNRYTSVEARHLFDRGEIYSFTSMLKSSLREFHGRYIKGKGYRDGIRGLSLSLLMVFYRVLTYIKLWEMHEFRDESVETRYDRIRSVIVKNWNDQ